MSAGLELVAIALRGFATRQTGIRLEALREDAIGDLAARLLASDPADLLDRLERRDPSLAALVESAAGVGETYFFRQPDHLDFIATELLAAADRRAPYRAWSAGCSTGEETWSLAATLRAAGPPQASVVGTDMRAESIAFARTGRYARRSLRDERCATPGIAAFEATEEALVAHPDLRAMTTFEVHNLLTDPPEPPFDLVLCRNVLVYFTPRARARACANIAVALAPGGVVLFSPMDVTVAPPGLERIGDPQLQAFRRPRTPALEREPRPTAAARIDSATRAADEPDAVALHLVALAHVERGEDALAARILGDLLRASPKYLPAWVESALLRFRNGELRIAASHMREVLARAEGLDPNELVAGPEPLPVSFYTRSARALLERSGTST